MVKLDESYSMQYNEKTYQEWNEDQKINWKSKFNASTYWWMTPQYFHKFFIDPQPVIHIRLKLEKK
jgi:hypothetical protein